jgi:fatty-acid desaturase
MKKIDDSLKLFLFQIVAHIGLVLLLIYGTWLDFFLTFFIYFITGCLGVTMTFHRLLSHKSWKAPSWFYYFGSVAGVWGIIGSPCAWVATHRAHHRDTDNEKDPHSPLHKDWWKIQWFSMFESVNIKYSVDLLRDSFQVWLHKNYFKIHITILLVLLLISPWLLIVLYLAPAAILWNAGSAINTASHLVGYRNHDTKDNSRCNLVLGYFVFGEGWHNNHHFNPHSPSFKTKWWEFDIGYQLIKIVKLKEN